MIEVYTYAFISVLAVSLISLIGIFALSLNAKFLKKITFILVSLAAGALFGDAIIHLLPEAFETSNNPALVSFFVLAGIIAFFILETFLHWHHHPLDEEHHKSEELLHTNDKQKIKPLGILVLTSDSVHNFIDGIIIGASYLVSMEVGIATTIAVILHEIPQEISDFGVLIHAGFTRTRALLINFATALFAIIGLMFAFILQDISNNIAPFVAAFAAGNFLYIAGSDLIPELHKTHQLKRSFIQLVTILIGIGIMFLLLFFD